MTFSGPETHVFEGPLAYKFKSCGQAVPGVELKIADENGNEVKSGEVGEIYELNSISDLLPLAFKTDALKRH